MPTNFPTLLDEFSNPSGADAQSSAPVLHSTQHVNANDAIEALQAKVGVDGSTDPDSLDYKIAHFDPAPSSTDAVEEGSSNLYFTYQRVCDTVLTALSTATNTAITATDTLLAALGKLQAQVTNKVDKEVGKGLSKNDYTDTEKSKLAGIEAGANAYTHPTQHAPSIIAQDASNRFVTDAEKEAWNAKQGALGFTAENSALKGAASGYAPLGSDSKIPSTYLPSYVDDVVEGTNLAAFPGTGETSKIYVALDSNKAYRWSGSSYVEISDSPGSTDAVTEGSANLYFTVARVRATVLTGLSLATNAAITATDSVLSALGKLQKQITDLASANTGDETQATIKTKLGVTTLSGSNTGDQTLAGLGGVSAASPSTSGTLTHSGDVLLSGSGKRITGDFSNATLANRLMFQSSTVNGATDVGVAPNGTSTTSRITAYNAADPTNASTTALQTTSTQSKLIAGKTGTGTYMPLTLNVGGFDYFQLSPTGLLSGINGGGIAFTPQGVGTVTTTLQKKSEEVFSVFATMTEAQVSDVTSRAETLDVSAAIIAADSVARALGKTLFFPAGTYLAASVPLGVGSDWLGESELYTVMKLKNGANSALLTSPTLNTNNVSIQRMRFDGNSANNTSAHLVTISGQRTVLRDITIVKAAGWALTTSNDPATVGNLLGCNGHFEHIIIDTCMEGGWNHQGPSDSNVNDVVIIDVGLRTNNTYPAFNCAASGRYVDFHCWNRWDTTNVPSVGAYVSGGGGNFFGCHFEGATIPLSVTGTGHTFSGCDYYAPRGAYCVSVTGTGNRIDGQLGLVAFGGNPNYKGVYLAGVGNTLTLSDIGCLNGAIEFGGADQNNTVMLSGYRASGTIYTGTPHASDDVTINVGGAAGLIFRQSAPLPWTAYTPSIAPGAGAFTSTTSSGRSIKTGSTVNFSATGSIGATGVGTGSGALILGIPFTAGPRTYAVFGIDLTTGNSLQGTISPGGTTMTIVVFNNTSPVANNLIAVMSGTYEAA